MDQKWHFFAQYFQKVHKSRQISISWQDGNSMCPSPNFLAKALRAFAQLLPPCDSIWLCSCIFVGLWGTTCFALTSFQPFQKVVFIFRIYRRFYTLVIAISSWNLFPHMWQCKLQVYIYVCNLLALCNRCLVTATRITKNFVGNNKDLLFSDKYKLS